MRPDPHSPRTSGDELALCALNRFGLGARPGDRARIASDPRGAVEAELDLPGVALLSDPSLATTEACFRLFLDRRAMSALRGDAEMTPQLRTAAEILAAAGRLPNALRAAFRRLPPKDRTASANAMSPGMAGSMAPTAGAEAADPPVAASSAPSPAVAVPKAAVAGGPVDAMVKRGAFPYQDEVAARFGRARSCEIGFVERLVMFWSNHFTVSIANEPYVQHAAGAFEREAIRPHALGRFSDMAAAATRHPAMLKFLQNDLSFGPNSALGVGRRLGLNENHARELLELHTVGVSGGYSQADVTALAKAMTGWRTPLDPAYGAFGRFDFLASAHEPGDRTIMGKVYKDRGVDQAADAILDFARKPATADHVARRFAAAFVSDDPPPPLVARLARSFRDTDGDLKQLARTLVASDEAWDGPAVKMRSPQEFVLAIARMLRPEPDVKALTGGLETLGQQYWNAPSPKGYSLLGRDWIAPDSQTNRLDLAVELAGLHAAEIDPADLAYDVLGDVMSDETAGAVKRAGSREQGLALLMMSPEIQRR